MQHSIEHFEASHAAGSLCDALDSLTVCAPDAVVPALAATRLHELQPAARPAAPRVAEAPPFLSQGPPPAA